MKLTLLLLFACVTAYISNLHAQRFNTSSNINISCGVLKDGYIANLGYEKFFSFKTSIAVAGNFLYREQKIKNVISKGELSSYFLDVKYKYYLTGINKLFPYAGAGLFGGYKTFDNEKEYSQVLKIDLDDSVIYGVIGEIGVEYNLRSFSFVLNTTPMYEFKDDKFYLPVKFGIKYFY